MKEYTTGKWGLQFIFGIYASPIPKALVIAAPNGVLAWLLCGILEPDLDDVEQEERVSKIWWAGAGFTSVLTFLLFFRATYSYRRWWEGGTLLQQTRGEWFNAYSSLVAFASLDPAKQPMVDEFQHLLARLMSLLFCAALQQVSPNQAKPFEVLKMDNVSEESLAYLDECDDKVEVVVQWIQRSTVYNMSNGVLPIPPPVISRVFQELSRGIVNLQNARKIALFPFPFPLAQMSVIMLLVHWCMCPVLSAIYLPQVWAGLTSFVITLFLWSVNYTACMLEMPYGDEDNDLPLDQMQRDWNRSLSTLLTKYAQRPPKFDFDKQLHGMIMVSMSDGADVEDPFRVSHWTISKFFQDPRMADGEFQREISDDSVENASPRKVDAQTPRAEEKPAGKMPDSVVPSPQAAVMGSQNGKSPSPTKRSHPPIMLREEKKGSATAGAINAARHQPTSPNGHAAPPVGRPGRKENEQEDYEEKVQPSLKAPDGRRVPEGLRQGLSLLTCLPSKADSHNAVRSRRGSKPRSSETTRSFSAECSATTGSSQGTGSPTGPRSVQELDLLGSNIRPPGSPTAGNAVPSVAAQDNEPRNLSGITISSAQI